MNRRFASGAVALVLWCSALEARGFGLECWTSGTRHHHELTSAALQSVGFHRGGAYMVGWNNDSLDYYLQHPTVDVLDYMKYEWDKLHFDDLYSGSQITRQWQRYLQGAFYGLLWLAEQTSLPAFEKYLAAANILGVTLHAFEDFYSHSTWLDLPERRSKRVFDYTRSELEAMTDLYTARVNSREEFAWGVKDGQRWHGGSGTSKRKKAFGCGCGHDAGINLDRTCSANIAVKNRNLPDKPTGQALFDSARRLAMLSDMEVARRIEAWLEKAGHGKLWKTFKAYDPRVRPEFGKKWAFSGPNRVNFFDKDTTLSSRDWTLPFTFVGGGVYKAFGPWYFRVIFETDSGTDAAIVIRTNVSHHRKTRLDRTSYDDFERGAKSAYDIGPYPGYPAELRVEVSNSRLRAWKVKRVSVWAYRIGGRAMFGKVAEVGPATWANGVYKIPLARPRDLGFDLESFKLSQGPRPEMRH